jgi:hypothetical protein
VSIVHLDTGKGKPGTPEGGEASEAEFVDGLRRRSAEALEKAYDFLRAQDDSWALLRAEVLCEGRPGSDLTAALAAIQEDDGRLAIGTLVSGGGLGFPRIALDALDPQQAGIVGTLEGLLQAGDARVLHGEWVERAAHFLETAQDADGAFRIPTIGDEVESAKADIFWTGMTGGILGRTPVARPSLLEAAGDFIGERFDPEVVEQDGFSALIAYAHFFTNVAHDLSDEALQWCGRALEKGFRSRQHDGVATVRVLLTCDAQAMPGATFDVVELLSQILEEQAGDGGFAELSVGGPGSRTTQTFDAMLGIVRLCAALEV